MALSKKQDTPRRVRALKRHLMLLIKPLLFATCATFVWVKARAHGHHFHKGDENVVIAGITILVVPYGIFAAFVLSSVWEKYKKVMQCVFDKDPDTFLKYRDERMPILIHLLLCSLSLPLIILIGGLDYEGTYCGGIIVFSASLAFTLMWLVATELENPSKSVWFAERVPPDWLTIDIDAHFHIEEKLKSPNIVSPP